MTNQLICGDNIQVVSTWDSNYVDGICTDPPYGLEFMGKEWDKLQAHPERAWRRRIKENSDEEEKDWGVFNRTSKCAPHLYQTEGMQQWHYQWAKAMLRITKPGGFLLCFGGTRTHHRLACAIEDAGWEIRDCMAWFYGSGFPKSHNISKAIDKAKGHYPNPKNKKVCICGKSHEFPFTEKAKLWAGKGTALKPAWEPIIVAMKPLDGTFAQNAEAHGVAGLNIDAARIGTETRRNPEAGFIRRGRTDEEVFGSTDKNKPDNPPHEVQGRWPANLILDEEAGATLDEQSGILKSGKTTNKQTKDSMFGKRIMKAQEGSSGGASRFFYCAKTSRKERNIGMEDCEDKLLARSGGARGAENRGEKEYLQKHIGLNRVAVVKNNHPTVKPLALMKYLCTLLKMPGDQQIILDPFMGSGTTGMACASLGIGFIGIEKEPDYCEISAKRIGSILGKPLPVTKNVETVRTTKDSAGGKCRRPNESLPHVSENRQSIINAASAALRKNKKCK